MTPQTISNGILRSIAILVGIVILLWFLYTIQSVIAYIAIAGVVSLLGRPIKRFFLIRLKFGDTLSVVITMLLFFLIFVGIISMFIPLAMEQSKNLSLLDINKLQGNIENLYQEFITHFNLQHQDVEESMKDSKVLSNLNFGFIPDFINAFVAGFGSFSIGLFSVLFISFFFLKDSSLFGNSIMSIFPKEHDHRIKRSLLVTRDLLSRYFSGLLLQLLILFSIYSIILLIFGIKNAVIIASLCALLNVIPYVGPIISAVLIILLTMSSNLGESFSEVILPKTIYVMIGFIIAQLVDNFFSQPYIFSKSVKSHPLEIFIIIIIAGLLFGVVGLIIAIPVYTAIKVIAKEFLSEYRVVKKLTKGLDMD
ncbi:AI-2E family transporter [Lacinutrix sp. Hel_I_90]|uniref:AI-2E family transporter n=1 Tax=Lacinutrix sp. Hel_I_90 TaxID=1249999 RepID=UPI0005C98888|nr:AI-2E family transporter [Lacinutrix sp. Hel_I_90]